ncbi:unnamed protein product [Microthlaspi erraticum]|uniref:Uncharacterized protein n=1 Tax=Microthlaspi erraticum TaxID=1685480 RepID=A0A6D2JX68_9BRAS|nr:unnamed protein product [Microthlaspi erraticum]
METTTTLPPQSKPPHLPYSSVSHHRPPARREDWWSEEATETLIQAWGHRYLKLNFGNLRQIDWKEVAAAVNSSYGNDHPKTETQCRNRIDTLKKKYKTEKAKLSPSAWRFFDRFDVLLGPVLKKKPVKPASKNLYRSLTGTKSTGSSLDDDEAGDLELVAKKHPRVEEEDLSEGSACKELARAILKFGEVYERTEGRKQKVLIELEKKRMEVAKELELQRMNMLMELQFELEKSKHRKRGAGSGSSKSKCREDYKILRFYVACLQVLEFEVEIYDVKSHLWESVETNFKFDWCFDIINPRDMSVSLKGNMYWIAQRIKSKKFYLSGFGGDRLSLLSQHEDVYDIEVWATNKVSDEAVTWSKCFSVVDLNKPVLSSYYHRTLPTFLVHKTGHVMLWCEEIDSEGKYVNVYELSQGQIRQQVETGRHQRWDSLPNRCYLFTPSLVPVPE